MKKIPYEIMRREAIHHRSLLLGIFIGSSLVMIMLLVVLPSISMNYPYDEAPRVTINAISSTEFAPSHRRSENIPSTTVGATINLREHVRILCMIFTYEKNFKERAYLIKRTWGARCTNLLFMSNMTDPNNLIDVTVLNLTESRDTLWKKTKLSFKHAYEHHLNDYDWFLKADDDTYVVMENLRHYLYPYPPDVPLIFGYQFNTFFMSGGAGYVLSREAVKLFIEKAVKDKDKCSQNDSGAEDAEIGHCLHNVFNATFGDTRDEFGKERFFPVDIGFLIKENDPDLKMWYWSSAEFYHNETGLACCSNTAITFHYMSPEKMLAAEYLLYHMKVHKMEVALKDLPPKFTKKETDVMFPRRKIGKRPPQP